MYSEGDDVNSIVIIFILYMSLINPKKLLGLNFEELIDELWRF